MTTLSSTNAATRYRQIYFYNTPWLPVYTAFCILGSIPFLAITLPLGLTVADDAVFGALVVVGGPLGDFVFRKLCHRVMYFIGKIQAIWIWPLIGAWVMIFQPLQ